MAAKKDTKPMIKKLWGIAKCPELKLSDEDLHLIVAKYTGKDSIRELNSRELNACIREIGKMRDSAKKSSGRKWGGNPQTENQRKKIYKLTKELGWDKPSRVNGLCMRMFKVSGVEWLTYQQCSKLIEALKKMLEREKDKEDEKTDEKADDQCSEEIECKDQEGDAGERHPST